MNEISQDVLCVLLQTLLRKGLISRSIHDKARNRILGTLDLPTFFRDMPEEEEETHGREKNPYGAENGQINL